MGIFTKKADPLTDRARSLTEQIAALEEEIQSLDSRLADAPPPPRLRSTAMPHGASTVVHTSTATTQPAPADPIFEDVDQVRLKDKTDAETGQSRYNELGVRKYDLSSFFRKAKNHVRGPSPANSKLVSYLAAGSIQGLRPMRYEKRIARYRFIGLTLILLLALIGILASIRR